MNIVIFLRKFSKPNIVPIPIQLLLSSFKDNNLYQNNSIFDFDKDIILEFKLNIISSNLSKTTHFTFTNKNYIFTKNYEKINSCNINHYTIYWI